MMPKERARLVVCLEKREACSPKLCRWAVPRRAGDDDPDDYECLLVGKRVQLGRPSTAGFTEGRPKFWLRAVVKQPGGAMPFDKGVVLAVAKREDTYMDVTWQIEPLHRSTHIVVDSSKGPGGFLWYKPGHTGWFSNDAGEIPEGYLYFVEWAPHSRGWAKEEDLE